MTTDHEIIAANGNTFIVEQDTAAPGVMIDFYLARADGGKFYNELVSMGLQPTTAKPPISDRIADGDADNFMIVPAECVRRLGERLIALANEHEAEWRDETEDSDDD